MDKLSLLRILGAILLIITIVLFFIPVDQVWFRASIGLLLIVSLLYQALKRREE